MRDEYLRAQQAEEDSDREAVLTDLSVPVKARLSAVVHQYLQDRKEFQRDIVERPDQERIRLLQAHEEHLVNDILTVIDSEIKRASGRGRAAA